MPTTNAPTEPAVTLVEPLAGGADGAAGGAVGLDSAEV
jgi:hypothetical protein